MCCPINPTIQTARTADSLCVSVLKLTVITDKPVIAARHRVRADDARRVRVRAYASLRDAYVRAYARFRLRRADDRAAAHRAYARAYALLLRACVRVRVLSLPLPLLMIKVEIIKGCHYTRLIFVAAMTLNDWKYLTGS